MSRPISKRRVREDLAERVFKPQATPMAGLERVPLSLDGLEALRLVDLEGLYQEEAARRMGVSRATLARVLVKARAAVADALVHGKAVAIGGGVLDPQPVRRWPCPVHGGKRRRGRGCRCRLEEGRGRAEAPSG